MRALIIVIYALSLTFFACNKQTDTLPPPIGEDSELETKAGLNVEDLEAYDGDIGLLLSARTIARKGYKPHVLDIKIDAQHSDLSQQIILNPLTLIGQLKFAVADLSEAAIEELSLGVAVDIRILDDAGNLIKEERLTNRSFKSSPAVLILDADDLEDLNTTVHLNYSLIFFAH